MKIKNIEIKNSLFLAPMAGVTDKAFRTLCKEFGVGLTTTEMVSVKGLYYNSENTFELLETSSIEKPCAVQLFGHEPEIFENVIKSGVLDKFDVIDINMGCPAPKIVKNGDGSALMKDINLASEIIKACVRATTKPITVKFRKGFYKNDDKLVEFAQMCEKSGASAVTVHPRTREDFFSGEINIDDIKKVKESVSIPVIGNGEVKDLKSYLNMLKSGCDGVMIGRASVGKPEIFEELTKYRTFFEKNNKSTDNNQSFFDDDMIEKYTHLKDSQIVTENDLKKKKFKILCHHLELLRKDYKDEVISKIFKRHILSYLSSFKNANVVKREIVLLEDVNQMMSILEKFFLCD